MKKISILIITFMLVAATTLAAGSGYGAKRITPTEKLTVQSILEYAAEEEYLARANYKAAITMTGTAKPFSDMVKKSDTDIASLQKLFTDRQLPVPTDESKIHVTFPFDFNSAKQAGEQMEADRLAMYERFLREPNLPNDLRVFFLQVKETSMKNLRTFQR